MEMYLLVVLHRTGQVFSTTQAGASEHIFVKPPFTTTSLQSPGTTQPPFTTQRAREARLGGVLPWMRAERNWVFSGSAVGWAGPLEPLYDLVVYLRLDQALRMARLRAREVARYGARIDPGGDMAVASAAFMAWAEAYDTAGPGQRSAALHALWLAERACRVVRLDSAAPLADLVARVVSEVAASRPVTTPSERTGAKR